MARSNWPSAPYSRKTFQSLSRGTRSNAFSRSTKHACKAIFAILPRFLEVMLQSEDLFRGATTRTKTALAILQFWFYYFSEFPFKACGIFFSWQTREWYPSVVCSLLVIFFLEDRNNHTILPISGSFAILPQNLTNSLYQRIPSSVRVFNIVLFQIL